MLDARRGPGGRPTVAGSAGAGLQDGRAGSRRLPERQYPKASVSFMERVGWWVSFQPIDLLLCTPGAWGCRFLTVTDRVIVAKVWDTATFVALRAGADVDAKHRASFEGARLRKRTLRFANLTASQLFAGDLTDTDLRQARLFNAHLQGADLTEANLRRANLSFANLTGANLIGAHPTFANLIGANLTSASLAVADLTGANLTNANLSGADLHAANLTGADLTNVNLSAAHLNVAQLTGADLRRTNLRGADLTGADLTDANLTGADLSAAANLIQRQLNTACGTDAKLPPGLTLHKPCSVREEF